MGLKRWAARRGAVGGTARWAAKGYHWFNRKESEYSDKELFRALIENRFIDRNKKSHLLNVSGDLNGLLDLVVAVLDVEADFSENTIDNQNMYCHIIVEELMKLGVPRNIIISEKPNSSVSTPCDRHITGDKHEYPFLPNMPDITACEPDGMWEHGQYLLILVKQVPTLSERIDGEKTPLRYESVMSVFDTVNECPAYFVTLESGITGKAFLCVFNQSGLHINMGPVKDGYSDYDFTVDALELIEKEFDILKAAA